MSYLYASNKNNNMYIFSDTKVTFSDKEEDILFNVLKKKTDDFENLKKFGTTEDKSTYTEAFKKAIEDPNDDVVG